jgi:hypothetical protein
MNCNLWAKAMGHLPVVPGRANSSSCAAVFSKLLQAQSKQIRLSLGSKLRQF